VCEAVGETGVLVPPREPEAFARACIDLLLDDERRRKMADAARHRALDLFTMDTFLTTYREVYSGVAASRADASAGVAPTATTAALAPSAHAEPPRTGAGPLSVVPATMPFPSLTSPADDPQSAVVNLIDLRKRAALPPHEPAEMVEMAT
jgi:hypothetical protein